MHYDLLLAGFECIQSEDPDVIYEDYLSDKTSVRYVRKGHFLPEIELKLATDELDDHQIRTLKKLPLTDLDIYFSNIEMNIAFKEELLMSKKDIEDANHLRIIYSDEIDENEIKKIKAQIRRLRLS